MAQQKIQFRDADEILQFATLAEKCDFPVEVSYKRTQLNGKSLVALFSLGLYKTLTVYCHGEDEQLMRAIQRFTVA